MRVQRIFRPNRKSPAERDRERQLRERLQRERPSLADLIRSGDCDPDTVITMGMYFKAMQDLKRKRKDPGA
jgi:hypothetical protein